MKKTNTNTINFTSITYRRFLHILEDNTILNKDVLSIQLYSLPFETLEKFAMVYKNTYLSSKDNKFFVDYIIKFRHQIRLGYATWNKPIPTKNLNIDNDTRRKLFAPNFGMYGFTYHQIKNTGYFDGDIIPALELSSLDYYYRFGYLYTSDILNSYFYRLLSEFGLVSKFIIFNPYTLKVKLRENQYLGSYNEVLLSYIKVSDIFNNIFNLNKYYRIATISQLEYKENGQIIIIKRYYLSNVSVYYNYLYGAKSKKCSGAVKTLIHENNFSYLYNTKFGIYYNDKLIEFNNLEIDEQIKMLFLITSQSCNYSNFITEKLLDDTRIQSPQIAHIFDNNNNILTYSEFILNDNKVDFEEVYEVYTLLFNIANKDKQKFIILIDFIRKYFIKSSLSVNIFKQYLKEYKTIPDQMIESNTHYTYNEIVKPNMNISGVINKNNIYKVDTFTMNFYYIKDKLTEEFMSKFNRTPKILDTIAKTIYYYFKRECEKYYIYDSGYIMDRIIKSYVKSFNIKSIRAIRNFNSIQLLDISTKYDLSHLDFRVLLHLHYFDICSAKYPNILDSDILKYIIKNGNKLSLENLREIFTNIDILVNKECKNLKQIRYIILQSKALKEKEDYEDEYENFDFSKNKCILDDYIVRVGKLRMYMLAPTDLRLFTVGISTNCCYHFQGAAENSLLYSVCMPNSTALVIEDNNKQIKAQAWVWCSKDRKTLVFDNIEFANDGDIEDYIDIIREYVKCSPYENIHLGMGYMDLDVNELLIPHNIDLKEEYIEIPLEFDGVSFEKIDTIGDELYSDYYESNYAILKHNGICLMKEES